MPELNRINILIDFKINKDYIAKVLCINKDEPITICGGNCYLTNQLKRAEEQKKEAQSTDINQKSNPFVFYSKTEKIDTQIPGQEQSQQQGKYQNDLLISPFVSGIFHPPKNC